MGAPADRHRVEIRQSLGKPQVAAAPSPFTASLAASVVVVTGLPRAGTSMAMQMLAAGAGARGQAVKIVTPLVRHLPRGGETPSYLVVHMRRPIDEVVASQRTMPARAPTRATMCWRRCSTGSSEMVILKRHGKPVAEIHAYGSRGDADGFTRDLDYEDPAVLPKSSPILSRRLAPFRWPLTCGALP